MRVIFALALACPSAALAQTIDFEALETTVPSFIRIDDVTGDPFRYDEDGFVLRDLTASYGFYRWGIGSPQYIANGSTNMYNNGPGAFTQLTRAGGGTFSLASIDIAELNGAHIVPVTFVGTRADGSVVTFTAITDGIAYVPETFTFPVSFQDLVEVQWTQDAPYHTFDNIVTGDSFGLDVDATCPAGGAATVRWRNGTPGGTVALIRATGTGSFTIPAGGCSGTQLGLQGNVSLVGTYASSPAGSGNLAFNLPAGACGRYLQAVDLNTCATSGVFMIQ